MSDISTMRDHIEDLMSEVSDLRAERDGLRELCFLLLKETEALSEAEFQEDYDDAFSEQSKIRRDELIKDFL